MQRNCYLRLQPSLIYEIICKVQNLVNIIYVWVPKFRCFLNVIVWFINVNQELNCSFSFIELSVLEKCFKASTSWDSDTDTPAALLLKMFSISVVALVSQPLAAVLARIACSMVKS